MFRRQKDTPDESGHGGPAWLGQATQDANGPART
jgi:hypothetical protein